MARYLDVIAGLKLSKARHWFIHGSDKGIILDAVDAVRGVVEAKTEGVICLDARTDDMYSVFEALTSSSIAEEETLPPLVLLWNAEHFDFSGLDQVRPSDLPSYLIAVSNSPERDPDKTKFFKKSSARAVKCRELSGNELVKLVWLRLGADKDICSQLVQKCAANSLVVAAYVRLLLNMNIADRLTRPILDLIVPSSAQGDFISLLSDGKKAQAVLCIPNETEAPKVLRNLEDLIVKGSFVNEVQANIGWSPRLLSQRCGLKTNELNMIKSRINSFDKASTARRLAGVTRFSKQARRGDRTAWLSLVALW